MLKSPRWTLELNSSVPTQYLNSGQKEMQIHDLSKGAKIIKQPNNQNVEI